MRPLILDYAVQKEQSDNVPSFQYSYTHSLNVVKEGETETPVIDMAACHHAQYTETRKLREEADQSSILCTETKAPRESSDREFFLLELETKTLTAREKDDDRSYHY